MQNFVTFVSLQHYCFCFFNISQTAYSTTWAIYLLSLDENLQTNICREYKTNSHQAPLLKGLVKETLRLYPVAPFIGRYMAEDCIIDNYFIKKNVRHKLFNLVLFLIRNYIFKSLVLGVSISFYGGSL